MPRAAKARPFSRPSGIRVTRGGCSAVWRSILRSSYGGHGYGGRATEAKRLEPQMFTRRRRERGCLPAEGGDADVYPPKEGTQMDG
jgi:hypothetical protein